MHALRIRIRISKIDSRTSLSWFHLQNALSILCVMEVGGQVFLFDRTCPRHLNFLTFSIGSSFKDLSVSPFSLCLLEHWRGWSFISCSCKLERYKYFVADVDNMLQFYCILAIILAYVSDLIYATHECYVVF